MLTRRSFAASLAGGLACVSIRPLSAWPAAGNVPVRMTAALAAATHCIAWIGTEAGVFRRHGLDVTFPRVETTGPESVAGLRRGDWEFAQTGTVPVAEDVLKGGDAVVLLRNFDPHVDLYVVTRPELTRLDQLAGRKVGVLSDAYSGQTGVKTRQAVEKGGATADYVGLGTYANIYAALARGEIDAGALPVHLRLLGERRYGWHAFPTGFGVPSVFATTRRLIASRRAVAVAAVKGFVDTIHLFKAEPDTVVPLLQRFLKLDDRQAAEDLRAFYAPIFPEVPRPALASGMPELRDLFAKRYPGARNLQEADIADETIIDEVERSGFIRSLYGH